jgi:hypothetical protein
MEIKDNTSLNMPIQGSLKASLLQPYTSWMWTRNSSTPNEIGYEISKSFIISKNIPNRLRIRIDPDFASYPPFSPRDHINLTTHFSLSSLVET